MGTESRQQQRPSGDNVTPIAVVKPAEIQRRDWTEPLSIREAYRFAEAWCNSSLNSGDLNPQSAFVVIATGAELGLTPYKSLRSIHIIKGRPCLSADLMAGLVKASPVCVWFRVEASTNELATYETLRLGEPKPTSMTFTIEDARRADLMNNNNWRKYPAAMCRARAASALARAVYPDVVGGLYDPDEMGGSMTTSQPLLEGVDATPLVRAQTTLDVMRSAGINDHFSDLPGVGPAIAKRMHNPLGLENYDGVIAHIESGHRIKGISAAGHLEIANFIRLLQHRSMLTTLPPLAPEPHSARARPEPEPMPPEPEPVEFEDGFTGEVEPLEDNTASIAEKALRLSGYKGKGGTNLAMKWIRSAAGSLFAAGHADSMDDGCTKIRYMLSTAFNTTVPQATLQQVATAWDAVERARL